MSLANGVAVNGVTGSLAIQGKDGSGTLRYIPVAQVTPTITRGDSVIPLVNNAAFACNLVKGSAAAEIQIDTYLFAGLMNADFFNAGFASGGGDTGASGYNVVTLRSNNESGEGAQTYAKSKFAGMSGSVRFSNDGSAQACRLGMRLMSVDPLSGSITALAAPSAGALSTTGILGFAQAAFSNASEVTAVEWNIDTGLQVVPGVVAGSNSEYPSLPKGVMLTELMGTVKITQIANPTTRLGSSGSGGTFTLSLGTTGAGIALSFAVIPMADSKPTTIGIGYIQSTYALKSVDGVTPSFSAVDL